MAKRSPAMQQLDRFKKRFPDCVLFFRMGDFYEMFDDDAVEMSKSLGLTLTERSPGQPMAGVPHHQLDVYLKRAVAAGYRVAIADQIQDPKHAKGVVARAVTRVITPGTLVDDGLVDDAAPNRVAAAFAHAQGVALAVVEVSSGTFDLIRLPCATGGSPASVFLTDELARRRVTELLIPEGRDATIHPTFAQLPTDLSTTRRPDWQFRQDDARSTLLDHYDVRTLEGFGLDDDDPLVAPAGALLLYLRETQTASDEDMAAAGDASTLREGGLDHLAPPRVAESGRTCVLDGVTLRALEVERTIRSADVDGSLLGLFVGRAGLCKTPMGKRLVRDWLCAPLADQSAIEDRQRRVAALHGDMLLRDDVARQLGSIQDVARIGARLALGRAGPRDLVGLGTSLDRLADLGAALANADAFGATRDALAALAADLEPIGRRIVTECVANPPSHLRDGGLYNDGVDAELDEARLLQRDAGQWLAEYQARLLAEHDLPGMKVGYNKVFGYYIELTAAQARSAPAAFTRKQTLKNAERYITPELKEFEEKVTTAESRGVARERALFDELCAHAGAHVASIRRYAEIVAELDALLAFALAGERYRWTRPEIVDEPELDIQQGRHPVLDVRLRDEFVPNDVRLGGSDVAHSPALALITGPNMAGKSTYIRQVALITLLAHTGSFVPAERAVIGITDRIFTRVGADDALHAGQSTFMVEMTETANILNNATDRSLVILDEIGRGTSTLDGLSLAWAIAERLAGVRDAETKRHSDDVADSSPRTLFATHYHEITELADTHPDRVANLHVSVREWGDEIVFLHRIMPGRTDQSYGVHVARLAGVPKGVIDRARQVLTSLAVEHSMGTPPTPEPQLSLFAQAAPHPAVEQLKEIKIESMSPLEAFDELRRLKETVDERGD